MTSRAFRVVEMFEEAMAEYAGSKHGVAVDSCTTAIFLSLLYELDPNDPIEPSFQGLIGVPKHTYISVPHAVRRAGFGVRFQDRDWKGAYRLDGTNIVDSALRMSRSMYRTDWDPDVLYCVSFHMRKHIKIGRGGMILTDDTHAAEWLRKMRFDGRTGSVPFMEDQVSLAGLNAYMTPEQAARGLQLLEALPIDNPDLDLKYPDLSLLPVFRGVML